MKGFTRETLGARLKKLRDDVHMEQEIVARVLSIPRTSVTAIEQGKRDVTAMELADLCKLYRVSPNELLNWKVANEASELTLLSESGSEK